MKQYDLEHHLRTIIHDEVRQYVAAGGSISKLATKAGICHQTVAKLAYHETKYPRMRTVLAVISALGYELELVKRDKNKLRVSLRAVS